MVNFYPHQEELIKQQATSFYELKRQQQQHQQQYANAVWEWQRQSRASTVNSLCLPPSEWPPLQNQQPGSAVFLNGSRRRQSIGTSVFLPRRVGAPTKPKKQQTCSTFLPPARVVQALNLNVEVMGVCRPRMPG